APAVDPGRLRAPQDGLVEHSRLGRRPTAVHGPLGRQRRDAPWRRRPREGPARLGRRLAHALPAAAERVLASTSRPRQGRTRFVAAAAVAGLGSTRRRPRRRLRRRAVRVERQERERRAERRRARGPVERVRQRRAERRRDQEHRPVAPRVRAHDAHRLVDVRVRLWLDGRQRHAVGDVRQDARLHAPVLARRQLVRLVLRLLRAGRPERLPHSRGAASARLLPSRRRQDGLAEQGRRRAPAKARRDPAHPRRQRRNLSDQLVHPRHDVHHGHARDAPCARLLAPQARSRPRPRDLPSALCPVVGPHPRALLVQRRPPGQARAHPVGAQARAAPDPAGRRSALARRRQAAGRVPVVVADELRQRHAPLRERVRHARDRRERLPVVRPRDLQGAAPPHDDRARRSRALPGPPALHRALRHQRARPRRVGQGVPAGRLPPPVRGRPPRRHAAHARPDRDHGQLGRRRRHERQLEHGQGPYPPSRRTGARRRRVPPAQRRLVLAPCPVPALQGSVRRHLGRLLARVSSAARTSPCTLSLCR
ncbi:uncharacterized protein RHOBADRAFT_53393, partial [Rhodotorula graminis WP1]